MSQEDNDSLSHFLFNSEDFYNVFTTCTLDDFRKIKDEKADNIVYLVSYVRNLLIYLDYSLASVLS